MIVPGSMWRMDSSTIIFDNVDLVRSPFRTVPEGSIVLVLAGPFKFERFTGCNPDQPRFWFLVDNWLCYDRLLPDMIEPVTVRPQ